MEVCLLDAVGLPPGCLLSVRAGGSRRQAPAVPDKLRLAFPKGRAATEPFRIDLLAPLGSVLLDLEPGVLTYPLVVPSAIDASLMRLTLQVRDNVGAGDEPLPPRLRVKPCDLDDAAAQRRRLELAARTYLDEHQLLAFVQNLLQAMIRERPVDPWAFVDECTKEARRVGVKAPAVVMPFGVRPGESLATPAPSPRAEVEASVAPLAAPEALAPAATLRPDVSGLSAGSWSMDLPEQGLPPSARVCPEAAPAETFSKGDNSLALLTGTTNLEDSMHELYKQYSSTKADFSELRDATHEAKREMGEIQKMAMQVLSDVSELTQVAKKMTETSGPGPREAPGALQLPGLQSRASEVLERATVADDRLRSVLDGIDERPSSRSCQRPPSAGAAPQAAAVRFAGRLSSKGEPPQALLLDLHAKPAGPDLSAATEKAAAALTQLYGEAAPEAADLTKAKEKVLDALGKIYNPEATAPSLERAVPAEEDTLVASTTINGVDFAKLTPAMKVALEQQTAELFAKASGVDSRNVTIELTAGSVVVTASIKGLAGQGSEDMRVPTPDDIIFAVKKVPDLETAKEEGATISASEPQAVLFKKGETKGTVATPKAPVTEAPAIEEPKLSRTLSVGRDASMPLVAEDEAGFVVELPERRRDRHLEKNIKRDASEERSDRSAASSLGPDLAEMERLIRARIDRSRAANVALRAENDRLRQLQEVGSAAKQLSQENRALRSQLGGQLAEAKA